MVARSGSRAAPQRARSLRGRLSCEERDRRPLRGERELAGILPRPPAPFGRILRIARLLPAPAGRRGLRAAVPWNESVPARAVRSPDRLGLVGAGGRGTRGPGARLSPLETAPQLRLRHAGF